MDELLIREIKQAINVISLLQIRESKFREELLFFNQSWHKEEDSVKTTNFIIFPEGYSPKNIHRSYLFAALRRLDHEVMFLCIDVYSLYEGVQKKKSLYASLIKDKGKTLMKIDKRETSPDRIIDLGIFNSSGWRESSEQEKEEYLKICSEEALQSRKELRDNFGPKSNNHIDMDEWIDSVLEKEIISKLHGYRKRFAHRLDSLDNLKEELMVSNPQAIQDRLDAVCDLLNSYQSFFQAILGYTTSVYYEGVKGTEYISLSQMQEKSYRTGSEWWGSDTLPPSV